jgi:hypothetical protein
MRRVPNSVDAINQFIDDIRPFLEERVDAMILRESPTDRLVLMQHREQILRTYTEAVRRRYLEHRLDQVEARLKPRLVVENR